MDALLEQVTDETAARVDVDQLLIEVQAIETIGKVLAPLDSAAKTRVLKWARARCNVQLREEFVR